MAKLFYSTTPKQKQELKQLEKLKKQALRLSVTLNILLLVYVIMCIASGGISG